MDFLRWNTLWSFCFGVMAVIIVVGNAISTSILLSKRFPQASTLPLNKPGNSGSSGWITCSAVVHNCSWSRTENFARGAIWLRGYVRRQILNVYSGRCFSWKTSRYCSATGNWLWVIIPWLYLLPGYFHLWSHQLGCCYISLSWQRRNSSPLLPSAYQRHCCYVFCLLPHLEKAVLKYT